MKAIGFTALAAAGVWAAAAGALAAGPDEAELAKKLANPVSAMITLPLQSNFECCVGEAQAFRYTLNVQPVMPVSLNQDWNVIVRTILPIVYQGETQRGAGDHFGVGDITQSFFFSPTHAKGFTWGAGPAVLWPIGDARLAGKQWAAGPTFVVLKQQGHVTFGLLANHLWTYARDDGRDEVNATFLQPFFSYTYPNSTTINITSETSYDWAHKAWTVPVIAGASHVYRFGGQRVQLALQGKFYATSPNGPHGGLRFNATFLFPK